MWIRTVRRQAVREGLVYGGVLAAAGLLLYRPRAVFAGISRGLSMCGEVLIPGLLPFLVLAGFLVRSGVCGRLGRRLEKTVRRVFGLPGCCGPVIIIGLVGGYPAGGAAAAELYRRGEITRDETRRLLRFCVNAGPAFVISTVGAGLLGSTAAGVRLYAAHCMAALLIGVVTGRGHRREPVTPVSPSAPVSPGVALVEAVNAASGTLLTVCGFVLAAAAALAVGESLGLGTTAAAVLAGLTEVSCGCVEVVRQPAAPLLLGMVMGWGGLSVHGQLAAVLKGTGLPDGSFFVARLWQAVLAGLLSWLLFWLIPLPAVAAGAVPAAAVPVTPTGSAGGAALLLTCGLFLLSGRKTVASGNVL